MSDGARLSRDTKLRVLEGAAAEAASGPSRLPSVEAVLVELRSVPLAQSALVAAVRTVLSTLRGRLLAGEGVENQELLPVSVAKAAQASLAAAMQPRLRRVVNATGVVLHTNLGRAALAEAAVQAAGEAATGAVNLEYDLERGERGERDSLVEEHLCALTGAEAATVVNNNAAAVVLVLSALARDREVIVSRGELIEIGGSFRLPDIMAASGARLREVGTTNRTRLEDYRAAVGSETALLMKVHPSNYRIVGFASSVAVAELARLKLEHPGVALVEDLGAGAVMDLAALGLAGEPLLADSLRAGADLVLCSGDKLLGGPQCGIIAGRAELVSRLRRHPLKRALRCDKMTLAALEATLRIYRFAAAPEREIPTLRRLLRPLADLHETGEAAIALLKARLGPRWSFELVRCSAQAGSGSQPGTPLDSLAIAVRCEDRGATAIEKLFRSSETPILGRVRDDDFLLDLRLIEDARELVPSAAS